MALTVPPQYINTPAPAVLDPTIPDSVYRTLALLHGLAWKTKGEKTPPATVLELAQVRGLKERQMYTHLAALKGRWIRIDNLGDHRIVVYPLRWENDTGAALPEESELTEEEIAALADEDDSDPTAKNYSSTAKNYSRAGPEGEPTAKNYSGEEEKGSSTAKNCSGEGEKSGPTAKNCSPMFLKHDHVVVDSVNESKQQHDMGEPTAKNCSSLAQNLTEAFIAEGVEPEVATATADDFIQQFGNDRCEAQLAHFHRHCELARASPRGLTNPIGLFFRAVQHNWRPPSYTDSSGSKTWYTDEESEFIQR